VNVKKKKRQLRQCSINVKTVFRSIQPSWSAEMAVLPTFQNHGWPASLSGFFCKSVPSVTGCIQGQGIQVRTNSTLILLLCFAYPVVDQ